MLSSRRMFADYTLICARELLGECVVVAVLMLIQSSGPHDYVYKYNNYIYNLGTQYDITYYRSYLSMYVIVTLNKNQMQLCPIMVYFSLLIQTLANYIPICMYNLLISAV